MWETTNNIKLDFKELNNILPSYIIDEVESSKNDSEDMQESGTEDNKVSIILDL